ncbi:MAG: EAL domain-containing protein [Planctomycetia bacterium]|jgi:diguanylate cyclase (GGDEF)-like protein
MELALPRIVVRVCGPGVGTHVIAALGVHPVEVAEAHDRPELQRVADGPPALLVVVVDPPDARAVVVETSADLPGVPILLVSDSAGSFAAVDVPFRGVVDTIRSGQPLPDICWHVLEAVSRAARLPGIAEHPLGPDRIEVDEAGIVVTGARSPGGAIVGGFRLRPGDSLLSLVEPLERTMIARMLERPDCGEARFCTVRLLGEHDRRLTVALALRRVTPGRVAVLVQPLICGGPIVGRHGNDRDPITGLFNRWALSRTLEARDKQGPLAGEAAVILATLDEFTSIGSYIGHHHTDVVLQSVASALNQVFPYPALTSRLMGDSFLAYVSDAADGEPLHRAEQLLRRLGDIEVPGFEPRFALRASIGVARVTDSDHDLAMRLAEAAAGEARGAGGNRVVVAGSAEFTGAQARELTASMDLGSWEVWLQPVARERHGRADFHEALARFGAGNRQMASRADLFIAGRAKGLLERFDRMMLQRALEILESHPGTRLSVNVTYETFVSKSFPTSFLDLIQRVPDGCHRLILEIASRCMAAPEAVVRPRLESLAAAGVAVAIDDFGSGICRLHYLTQLPLAIVKLDQLVTGYVDDDPLQRDFVRTVVSLCRARGITTIAEYTRNAEQLARLVEDGVDLFQGEFFGMPRPAAEVLGAPAVKGEPVVTRAAASR